MNKTVAKVLFVKVGKVASNKKLTSDKEYPSGIRKHPVASALLQKTGFIGDEQADLIHHGGETKAVLLFSKDTYQKLNDLSGNDFTYDDVAHYGENLLVEGVSEADICVGDIFKIGKATIEVSQPRQPCWKLSANTKTKKMTSLIYKNGLTGWYARVLDNGTVAKNDDIVLLERNYPNLTIEALNKIIVDPLSDKELTKEAIKCPILGEQFQESLAGRAKLKDPLNEPFWYHTEQDD